MRSVTFLKHPPFVSEKEKGKVKTLCSGYGWIATGAAAGKDVYFAATEGSAFLPGHHVIFDLKLGGLRKA